MYTICICMHACMHACCILYTPDGVTCMTTHIILNGWVVLYCTIWQYLLNHMMWHESNTMGHDTVWCVVTCFDSNAVCTSHTHYTLCSMLYVTYHIWYVLYGTSDFNVWMITQSSMVFGTTSISLSLSLSLSLYNIYIYIHMPTRIAQHYTYTQITQTIVYCIEYRV